MHLKYSISQTHGTTRSLADFGHRPPLFGRQVNNCQILQGKKCINETTTGPAFGLYCYEDNVFPGRPRGGGKTHCESIVTNEDMKKDIADGTYLVRCYRQIMGEEGRQQVSLGMLGKLLFDTQFMKENKYFNET